MRHYYTEVLIICIWFTDYIVSPLSLPKGYIYIDHIQGFYFIVKVACALTL